jgi:hypothetical protein
LASVSKSVYLAVCSVFRDEAAYLAEWIEFHRLVGVEHFFLYDNFSGDSGRTALNPWVRAGVVTLTDCSVPRGTGGQAWVYSDALDRARGRTRWLAFIDIDEFLFSPGTDVLARLLPDYETHPGVVVNWQVYGSSGLKARPPGLVIENFVKRAPTNWVRNRRVKSIVDPARALRSRGPHFFEYRDGALAVTENHEPVHIRKKRRAVRRLTQGLQRVSFVDADPYAIHDSSAKRVSVQRLRVNHYAVKSRQEFVQKVARHGSSGESDGRRSRVDTTYFVYHDRNDVDDPVLVPYAPDLKSRLEEIR